MTEPKSNAPTDQEGERLSINVNWDEAAKRLLNTPAGSTPERAVKPRKKKDRRPKK